MDPNWRIVKQCAWTWLTYPTIWTSCWKLYSCYCLG